MNNTLLDDCQKFLKMLNEEIDTLTSHPLGFKNRITLAKLKFLRWISLKMEKLLIEDSKE